MEISGARVSGVAHVANHFTLPGKLSGRESVRVTLQMGVIENQFLISAQLIDGCAAPVTLKQFDDFAISGGNDCCSSRGRNVDRVMNTTLGTCVSERVKQLFGLHTNHRNDEFD